MKYFYIVLIIIPIIFFSGKKVVGQNYEYEIVVDTPSENLIYQVPAGDIEPEYTIEAIPVFDLSEVSTSTPIIEICNSLLML